MAASSANTTRNGRPDQVVTRKPVYISSLCSNRDKISCKQRLALFVSESPIHDALSHGNSPGSLINDERRSAMIPGGSTFATRFEDTKIVGLTMIAIAGDEKM